MPRDLNLLLHYKTYFRSIKATTPEQKKTAFNIRYRVYYEEKQIISSSSLGDNRVETDIWDPCSIHSLLYHRPTGQPIGNVRLVPLHCSPTRTLPVEEHYPKTFDFSRAPVKHFRIGKTAEVSRMLIVSAFRRRKAESKYAFEPEWSPVASGDKRFPINYLPVCMIFATAILMLEERLDYGVGLMEPSLARLLKRFGVGLNQIGEPADYFGQRAPYLIFPQTIYNSLNCEYRELYDIIKRELIG